MKENRYFHQAAKKIAEILAKGIPVSRETLHFFESTFSISTPQDVTALLKQGDDEDRELLVSLLFFPDESTQTLLEPFFENLTFSPEMIENLAETVADDCPEAGFVFPHNMGMGKGSFLPSVSEINQFLSHLNLLTLIDERLLIAIKQKAASSRYYKLRVKFRNIHRHLSDEKIEWLCLFFKRIAPEQDENFKLLDFALAFLQEISDGETIYEALMHRKHSLITTLEQYHHHEKLKKNNNMETLMAKGIRIPCVNREDAVDKIACIDDICVMIYGKTDSARLPIFHQDLGYFEGESGMDSIFKAFR